MGIKGYIQHISWIKDQLFQRGEWHKNLPNRGAPYWMVNYLLNHIICFRKKNGYFRPTDRPLHSTAAGAVSSIRWVIAHVTFAIPGFEVYDWWNDVPCQITFVHHYYTFQGNLESLILCIKEPTIFTDILLLALLFYFYSSLLVPASTLPYMPMTLCLWCTVSLEYQTKFLALFSAESFTYCIGYSTSTCQRHFNLNSTFS